MTDIGLPCLSKASATTSIVSAEASIPNNVSDHRLYPLMNLLTSLDNIDTNVLDASIDLLFNKFWGRMMYSFHSQSVLSSESRSCSHSIALMNRNNSLIGF